MSICEFSIWNFEAGHPVAQVTLGLCWGEDCYSRLRRDSAFRVDLEDSSFKGKFKPTVWVLQFYYMVFIRVTRFARLKVITKLIYYYVTARSKDLCQYSYVFFLKCYWEIFAKLPHVSHMVMDLTPYTPPTSKHSQKICEYLNQIPTDKLGYFQPLK